MKFTHLLEVQLIPRQTRPTVYHCRILRYFDIGPELVKERGRKGWLFFLHFVDKVLLFSLFYLLIKMSSPVQCITWKTYSLVRRTENRTQFWMCVAVSDSKQSKEYHHWACLLSHILLSERRNSNGTVKVKKHSYKNKKKQNNKNSKKKNAPKNVKCLCSLCWLPSLQWSKWHFRNCHYLFWTKSFEVNEYARREMREREKKTP